MLEKSQEKRILELRQKGYGYKSIASILGIKRDTVRSLCKKYGLQGYLGLGLSKESEPQIREKNQYDHCIHCGKEINIQHRRGRKSKFCSRKCTVDYRYGSYKEKTGYEKRKEDGTAQDE